jgi:hypothetical protein
LAAFEDWCVSDGKKEWKDGIKRNIGEKSSSKTFNQIIKRERERELSFEYIYHKKISQCIEYNVPSHQKIKSRSKRVHSTY